MITFKKIALKSKAGLVLINYSHAILDQEIQNNGGCPEAVGPDRERFLQLRKYQKYPHRSWLGNWLWALMMKIQGYCNLSTWSIYRTFRYLMFNTLKLRQNGRRFADDTFKCTFLNENVRISIKISLKFVPNGPINNNPALVQIMAWRQSGDKPLSKPMMASLLTHICVTQPQWVNRTDKCTKIKYNQ